MIRFPTSHSDLTLKVSSRTKRGDWTRSCEKIFSGAYNHYSGLPKKGHFLENQTSCLLGQVELEDPLPKPWPKYSMFRLLSMMELLILKPVMSGKTSKTSC